MNSIVYYLRTIYAPRNTQDSFLTIVKKGERDEISLVAEVISDFGGRKHAVEPREA